MNEGWGAARTGGSCSGGRRAGAGRLHLGQGAGQADRHRVEHQHQQEVVYRLAGDASQTIDKNKDIF
jgi:hypothetical protein